MATKAFGSPVKTSQDYIDELHELAGVEFPINITVTGGRIATITYETTWKEGSTMPVATGEVDGMGNPVIEYEDNYSNKKLTAAQIKKVDAYIKKNIAE